MISVSFADFSYVDSETTVRDKDDAVAMAARLSITTKVVYTL